MSLPRESIHAVNVSLLEQLTHVPNAIKICTWRDHILQSYTASSIPPETPKPQPIPQTAISITSSSQGSSASQVPRPNTTVHPENTYQNRTSSTPPSSLPAHPSQPNHSPTPPHQQDKHDRPSGSPPYPPNIHPHPALRPSTPLSPPPPCLPSTHPL